MSRGASPAVVRAVFSDEPVAKESVVTCDMCGSGTLDFTPPDPLRIGRTMQQCSNPICPDRVLRPMVRRHL